MDSRYVAFGQLIDGEKTLQQIENVDTWYEAPTKSICIAQAGLLSMECQDIAINRGTLGYINNHIEDLVSLGNTLLEVRVCHLRFSTIKLWYFDVDELFARLTGKDITS